MRFDVDRLSKLAGVQTEGRSRLSEASNRSYHDKVANDEADYRFGKNQLSELGNGSKQGREPLAAYEEAAMEEMWGGGEDEFKRSGGRRTGDVGGHYKDYEMDEDSDISDEGPEGMISAEAHDDDDPDLDDPPAEDVVLEIDEGMLRQEILRMKRSRLEETRLRGAIRHEIQDIFASLTNDNSWVYGDNKPRNSKRGSVSMGFAGFGFKNK